MLDINKIKIERIPRYRGLRLLVLPNSTIILRCSKNESEKTISKFVFQHQDWIEKSLQKSKKLQFEYPQLSFLDGEVYKILGHNYYLKREEAKTTSVIYTQDKFLVARVPTKITQTTLKKHIVTYYFQMAQRILPERVHALAQQTQLIPKKVSLRRQKTLWGSCTYEGHIQLNFKLIAAPLSVIDYVIIHELAHLRHRNHSKKFWAEVEKFCPNYRTLRKWLRKEHYAFDFLNEYSELHSYGL